MGQVKKVHLFCHLVLLSNDRFASSQWEMSLQSHAVSHWLGANLESALHMYTVGHNIEYSNGVIKLEHLPDFELAINTPYLFLMGKVWAAYCKNHKISNISAR